MQPFTDERLKCPKKNAVPYKSRNARRHFSPPPLGKKKAAAAIPRKKSLGISCAKKRNNL